MADDALVALDSRKGIGIGGVFTSMVLRFKVENLELFKSPSNLSFWLFKLLNPFQSSMIRPYKKWAPQQIGAEVAKEVHQGQQLLPGYTVVSL